MIADCRAKKAAKAKDAPAAKAKSKSQPKAKAKAAAAVAPAAPEVVASPADVLPYRNVRITSATKGTVRSYLTGLDSENKRKLITELTAKQNPQHRGLLEALKLRIESDKMTKQQAVEWRDTQIL